MFIVLFSVSLIPLILFVEGTNLEVNLSLQVFLTRRKVLTQYFCLYLKLFYEVIAPLLLVLGLLQISCTSRVAWLSV